ncbi:hypothetical protein AOQ84DRAFT_276988, partial [Glonium stellatum]
HEIRNPLSAVLQSAEGILEGLYHPEEVGKFARTISICADHATRIMKLLQTEGILTLSKMDANLLGLAPDMVNPAQLAQQAIAMHEAELQRHNIRATLLVDESLQRMPVNTVILDESRVLQVLINL